MSHYGRFMIGNLSWAYRPPVADREREGTASHAAVPGLGHGNGHRWPVNHMLQIKMACKTTSEFEICFAIFIGSQHLGFRGSQPKHISNPDSVRKVFKPHLIYDCFVSGQGHHYGLGLWTDATLTIPKLLNVSVPGMPSALPHLLAALAGKGVGAWRRVVGSSALPHLLAALAGRC